MYQLFISEEHSRGTEKYQDVEEIYVADRKEYTKQTKATLCLGWAMVTMPA